MSVMVEAFVIGVLASVTGLFLGLGLAKGLNKLFVHFGIDLPQAGTVFATRTIVVSLAVGIAVTLLAALRPAIRATRVPPISAVREGAILPTSRFARFSAHVALLTIGGALALMLVGLFVGSLSTTQRLLAIGIGAAAVFLGVAMLAKTLVPPLARALGWPATRIGGAAGSLARGNAMRNPQRTASTASALMIGLALVTLVAVLASGLESTFENAVNSVFKADYALTSTDNFSPISDRARECTEEGAGREGRLGCARRRGQGVREQHRRHRRFARHHEGDLRQLAERLAGGARRARTKRRVRVQGLREVQAPSRRLGHSCRDADGAHDESRPPRDLLPSEGRRPLRRRHHLGPAFRPRVREPGERLRVRRHRRRGHRGEHGRALERPRGVPRREDRRPRASSRRTRSRASTRS